MKKTSIRGFAHCGRCGRGSAAINKGKAFKSSAFIEESDDEIIIDIGNNDQVTLVCCLLLQY
jgi:hypothetical protein